jgi:flavodoxin
MKTSIIYNSHSGTTKAYAEEIGIFLSGNGIECRISSIDDYDQEYLLSSDLVMLGCWTNGLMIFAQHPDKAWKKFVEEMPDIRKKTLALFTTYKIATGSMFRKMEKILSDKSDRPKAILKSRSKELTEENRSTLEVLINTLNSERHQ